MTNFYQSELFGQILDAMRAARCEPHDEHVLTFGPSGIGGVHRYQVKDDKAGSKNGWFIFYADGIPAGAFGSWKSGVTETWCAKRDAEMSSAERAKQEQRWRDIRAAREREQKALHVAIQKKAVDLWEKSRNTVDAAHPYLTQKQIPAVGIRQLKQALVVPVLDVQNTLYSLQFIGPEGEKRFLTGGAIQGHFCPLGPWEPIPKTILICEGYATGVTLYRTTQLPVAVAFNAGNLDAVGRALRGHYPHAAIVFCADDDRWNKETGARKAGAAAAAVDGAVILPLWDGVALDSKPTDFNDLQVLAGLDQVRAQICNALSAPECKSPYQLRVDFEQKIADTDDFETLAYSLPCQITAAELPPPTQSHLIKLIAQKIKVPVDDLRTASKPRKTAESGWQERLKSNDHDALLNTLANVALILNNHPDWRGTLFYDEFSGDILKRRLPPVANPVLGEWQDIDTSKTRAWLEEQFDWSNPLSGGLVDDAVALVADQHAIHVVREYLEGLQWDGTHRLKTWLISYLGAADIPDDELSGKVHRFVGQAWMVGAVKRAFEPGCKFDNVLVLEGPQGGLKSTTLAVLGGEWHAESITDVGSKDSLMNMRGKWLIEFSELDALGRVEISRIKQHISAFSDTYRKTYGRRSITVPRQNVFAATTNPEQYLKDETGARRFWPVQTGFLHPIDIDALRTDRDQLWAEAVHCYRNGEQTWADEGMTYLKEAQEHRYMTDPWEEHLMQFALGRREIQIRDALEHLQIEVARQTQADKNRVAKVLSRLGFRCKIKKTKRFLSDGTETSVTVRAYIAEG